MEMAGIEPASARLEHRTSTSVEGLSFHRRLVNLQTNPAAIRWSPKALFRMGHGNTYGTPTLCRLFNYRLENGAGRRGLLETMCSDQLLTQLMEEQLSLCVWHVNCVLILRGRYLSARRSGSASSVEAYHPRICVYYTAGILESY